MGHRRPGAAAGSSHWPRNPRCRSTRTESRRSCTGSHTRCTPPPGPEPRRGKHHSASSRRSSCTPCRRTRTGQSSGRRARRWVARRRGRACSATSHHRSDTGRCHSHSARTPALRSADWDRGAAAGTDSRRRARRWQRQRRNRSRPPPNPLNCDEISGRARPCRTRQRATHTRRAGGPSWQRCLEE